ncbi:MAG: hypothetical protein GY786_12570 [Proteobacteria bacterium]|nr:hypothetical protein [Pseudomonadota bacterium]
MKFLSKKGVSRRLFGAELVVTGAVLMTAKFLLGSIAPFALSAYGIYRMLLRKSYPDGVTFLASGILLWGALKLFGFLLWLPMLVGVGMIVSGGYYMIAPGAKEKIDED